jgi:hypothetical protein
VDRSFGPMLLRGLTVTGCGCTGYMGEMFQVTAERERIKTCLADLAETATAFRQMTQQGLEKLADALQPRLKARWLLGLSAPRGWSVLSTSTHLKRASDEH